MVIGIDEVGRGAWAGPLVFCAVALPENFCTRIELNDSKKLSYKKRELISRDLSYLPNVYVSEINNTVIDDKGLTECSRMACLQLIESFRATDIKEIIIDGSINYLSGTPFEGLSKAIEKADTKIDCVMAASVYAKNFRDKLMEKYAEEMPGYGFEKHVGYGTKLHLEKLKEFGVTNIHRRTFKPIFNFL